MPDAPLIDVRNLTKRFPGVLALDDVNLQVYPGEVLAVIGENGAGKSTLMKILAGAQSPDRGQTLIEGRAVEIDSIRQAQQLGIALIHQELNLADKLDVGANIYLGREPRRWGLIDRAAIRAGSREVLGRVGLDVQPSAPVGLLPIGRQQMVEIAKALSANARVLIMDEPTSSLSHHETQALFEVVKDLRDKGVAIVYISHRLGEVKELADRVEVLRDGKNAGCLSREEVSHDRMVRLMVGRDISQFYVRKPHQPGEILLEAKNLRTPTWPQHRLNFAIRAGEIVGVAGLVGAGRTEMLRVLFGVEPPHAGEVLVGGKRVTLSSPLAAIAAGVALVPEDRKQQGLLIDATVRRNLSLPGLRRYRLARNFLNLAQERTSSAEVIRDLKIKTPSDAQIVQYLSGGNQQKVVVGKWQSLHPRVLLLDEPTRGVDIGAKQEIYGLMDQLAARGVAILFASSEMEEIIGMSDRALVMHEGRFTGELSRDELNEEAVMRLATGVEEVSRGAGESTREQENGDRVELHQP
jgi:ribose transport system ATP-binding protein